MSEIDDQDWDVESPKCPVCGRYMIIPAGPKDSPILLVTEEPTSTEYGEGVPFIGQFAGVIRAELGLFGMDLRAMRRMTLWPHPPATGKGNKNKECLAYAIQQVVLEAKDRNVVVLFGADTCKVFLGVSSDEVSGLRMQSKFMQAIVLPCVAIGSVFNSGVGELRFALRELQSIVQELDLFPSNNSNSGKSPSPAKPKDEEVEDW